MARARFAVHVTRLAGLAAAGGAAFLLACGGGGGGGGPIDDGGGAFGLEQRVPVTSLTFPLDVPTPDSVVATDAFPSLPSFSQPVFATYAPDGTSRLFVVERAGRIRVLSDSPSVSAFSTFLDITARVRTDGSEEGLLGLAFHPNYAANGYFYVNYVEDAPAPRQTVIARYQVSSDPNVAFTGETRLLVVAQPYSNHNGGMLAFGPDGYLYASLGDGGSGGDPQNNGLNTSSLLGKVLRVDVDAPGGGLKYGIPAGNPFASSTGSERKEIWCLGLRNPWRFSFDRVTGTPWCGDVGQGSREEIDVLRGGGNFGWRAMEGTSVYDGSQVGLGPFDAPVHDYSHGSNGDCVIGGYVYRGTRVPALYGAYVYADNGSGRVWALSYDGASATSNVQVATIYGVSSFGEDRTGELLVCGFGTGRIYKLSSATPGGGAAFPQRLSETGIFTNLAAMTPSPGIVPYDLAMALWSDGALKDRLLALPGAERIGWSQDDPWAYPPGTVLVKTFRLPLVRGDPSSAVRVETRVLMLSNSGWEGFSYRWRDDQSDADLLPDAAERTLTIADPSAPGGTVDQTWRFPSRGACLRCHTQAAGRVLGLSTRNLNRSFDYGGVTDNQLRSWSHVGLFDASLPPAASLPAHPTLGDESRPVAARARAYLEVNCSICHRPGGPGEGMDLRSTVPVSAMGVLGVAPQHGNLGLADPRIVRSGDRNGSVLWLRMLDLGGNRMPPLASNVVDAQGADVVGRWIDLGP